MPLDANTIAQLAEHLENCELQIRDTPKITDDHPDMDWDDAYAIQNTILRCDMSKDLIIPNSKVHESAVTNLTREDSKIMASLFVSIACDSDLDEAEKIISDILTKEYYVLKEPKFMIRFNEFEEHAIKIKIMFFVDLKQIYDSDAASRVRHKIREAFAAAGIKRPLPRAEIQMKEKEEEI